MSGFFRAVFFAFLFVGLLSQSSMADDPAFGVHDDPPHERGAPPEVPRMSLGLALGVELPNNELHRGGPDERDSWGVGLRLGTSGRSHLAFTGRFLDYYYTPLRTEAIPVSEVRADMQIYEFMYGWSFHGGLFPGSRLVLETGPNLVRVVDHGADFMDAGVSAHLGWMIPLGEHVDLEPRLSILAMVLDRKLGGAMMAGAHLGIRIH